MNKIIPKLIALVLIINLFSCKSNQETFSEDEYVKSVKEWQAKRLEGLKSETGWLNLVGLHWLKEGQNPFGSSVANNVIFPENAPDFIGSYILYKG